MMIGLSLFLIFSNILAGQGMGKTSSLAYIAMEWANDTGKSFPPLF